MTVIDLVKDPATLTMTVTSEFAADAARVWQLWSDPRQLERWWGPPGYPATFTAHDLTAGGETRYYMTGPDGERFHGWWRVLSVDPPNGFHFEDGFADELGAPNPDLPVTLVRVNLTTGSGSTRMSIASVFPSAEAMEQVIAMGVEEGIKAALGQIDAILAGTRL